MLEQRLKELKSENSETRKQAAEELGTIGDVQAVDLLIEALKDKDCSVRGAAAKSLNSLGWEPEDNPRKALYTVALEDWSSAENLGKAAVEPLMMVLRDSRELLMQEKAAEALVRIGEVAVHPLIEALRDEKVRDVATLVLVDIGTPSIKPLIEALKDKDIRKAAAKALVETGGAAVEPLIDALMNMGI
ncbi:HEAT repeat domain-containing protein [Candidatus Poribacteria bacterium]